MISTGSLYREILILIAEGFREDMKTYFSLNLLKMEGKFEKQFRGLVL
jgi:hypothetical protein